MTSFFGYANNILVMKKFLPKTTTNSSGFTLIELLVVIAILAVLAVMGFAAFGGLTGRGNDSRRMADMKAFADAMEVKKGTGSAYVTVVATDFASGNFPAEPTTRTEKYCYSDSTTAAVANMAVAAGSACATGWVTLSGAPAVTSGATYFKFCTMNDKTTAVICQGSRQ